MINNIEQNKIKVSTNLVHFSNSNDRLIWDTNIPIIIFTFFSTIAFDVFEVSFFFVFYYCITRQIEKNLKNDRNQMVTRVFSSSMQYRSYYLFSFEYISFFSLFIVRFNFFFHFTALHF